MSWAERAECGPDGQGGGCHGTEAPACCQHGGCWLSHSRAVRIDWGQEGKGRCLPLEYMLDPHFHPTPVATCVSQHSPAAAQPAGDIH